MCVRGETDWPHPSLAGFPPMFCSKSLECPGTRSSAPRGRQWCHRLDLIAGQVFSFIPAQYWAGSQLPASASPVRLRLSWLWQTQACSWEWRASQGRRLQSGCCVGPGQAFSNWTTPFQLPFITASLEYDLPPLPPSWGLRSAGNLVLRTLEAWDRLEFASCPHFCSL